MFQLIGDLLATHSRKSLGIRITKQRIIPLRLSGPKHCRPKRSVRDIPQQNLGILYSIHTSHYFAEQHRNRNVLITTA
jgi:hypothetical protein